MTAYRKAWSKGGGQRTGLVAALLALALLLLVSGPFTVQRSTGGGGQRVGSSPGVYQ